jgi:hypothetical protein
VTVVADDARRPSRVDTSSATAPDARHSRISLDGVTAVIDNANRQISAGAWLTPRTHSNSGD